MRSKLGFTLLELLVVMGIIAILVGIGAVSYSSAQRISRDAKRKSDLKEIQKFYEQYYSFCGGKYGVGFAAYPGPGELGYPLADGTPIGADLTDCQGNVIIKYPQAIDPLGDDYLGYNLRPDSYTICPPVVRNEGATDAEKYLLESTNDCTLANKSCCVSNEQ